MAGMVESWLLARFREALAADEQLPPERLFTGKAPEGTSLPYGCLAPADARSSQWTAAGATVGTTRIRMTIRGEGLEEVRGLAARCERGLDRAPLQEGILDVCRMREAAAEESDGVWTLSLQYDVLWQRPAAAG